MRISFFLLPCATVLPWTRLGEKSSAPEEVMMGTPSRDLIEQFLPNRLGRRVADPFFSMDFEFLLIGFDSSETFSSDDVVDASFRSLSLTFISSSDTLSVCLNKERILDGMANFNYLMVGG